MTSLAVRARGVSLVLILIVLGITVYTGALNGEGNEGGAGAVALFGGGGIAFHATLGVLAFFVVLGHILLNHRVAVSQTKRVFKADRKGGYDPVQMLRGLVPIFLLVSLGMTIWTGFNSSESFGIGGATAELGEGGLHGVFIGLTALLVLGHMALNHRMIGFQLKHILALDRKKKA